MTAFKKIRNFPSICGILSPRNNPSKNMQYG